MKADDDDDGGADGWLPRGWRMTRAMKVTTEQDDGYFRPRDNDGGKLQFVSFG